MFRRKEDSLFDTTSDTLVDDNIESANVITPAQSAPASSATASSPSSASSYTPAAPAASAPQAAPSRPAAPVAPASSFRPSTSAPINSSEITRNRLPENKAPLAAPSAASSASNSGSKSPGRRVLTVGSDILLKGEIATCDRLVIEGKVDATLNDVHTVEIAESGSFKGSARIEDAEISGLFEGDLVVSGRLVIYATGRVRGKITYGEIEIERGGELTGEIKTTSSAASTSATASRPAARQNAKQDDKVAA
ncbi:MAG: polymer-forming cytoskeletal protein [Rickettsiales bacterium]|nr:polymer-forming cytoskeletal protein [Rickettsiales bacterium]